MSHDTVARAEALLDSGRPRQALELLSRELATTPDDVPTLQVLARAQLEVDPQAAVGTAQLLITLDPEEHYGHLYAALAHDELGNRTAALEHGRAAARIAPNDPYVVATYAIVRSRKSFGRREGMRAAKHAIALAPDDTVGYTAAGAVELHAGHWRRSAKWFERALEIDPHDPMARINLAIAKQGAGNVRGALGGTEALLRFDPTDRDARETLDDVVYTTLVHLLWIVTVLVYIAAALRGVGG